ncbi:MAG: response regulator transcription factor [Candidatus Sulfotelmatobacter sp.]
MMSKLGATPSPAVEVLIADSNRIQAQLLTSALRRRPEFSISTCAVDFVIEAVTAKPARVVLISLNQSVEIAGQMAAMRRLHLSHPEPAKVLLMESYDREMVVAAFRSGARGIFCLSDTHFRLLCRCIQRVADGQIWASTEQLNFLLEIISELPATRVVNSRGIQILTPREEQVVALIATSLSNRDIARELNLSVHTVKIYLFRIFDKLGLSSRVELAVYATNQGSTNRGPTSRGSADQNSTNQGSNNQGSANQSSPRPEKWLPHVRQPISRA